MPRVTKDHLPKGRKYGRPGYKLKGDLTFTVHNTSNEKPGADAETHNRYLHAGHAISWHATADHDSIVEHLPLDEQGWHTGTHEGNTTSIGIEVCEYPQTKDGRAKQAKATDNAAWWIAKQLKAHGMKPSSKTVRTHKSWSGKNCPRDLLPKWPQFIDLVKHHYASLSAKKRMPVLRKGSAGGAVLTLKRELAERGYHGFDIKSHTFGDGTKAALDEFKKANGLEPNGIAGAGTWKALGY